MLIHQGLQRKTTDHWDRQCTIQLLIVELQYHICLLRKANSRTLFEPHFDFGIGLWNNLNILHRVRLKLCLMYILNMLSLSLFLPLDTHCKYLLRLLYTPIPLLGYHPRKDKHFVYNRFEHFRFDMLPFDIFYKLPRETYLNLDTCLLDTAHIWLLYLYICNRLDKSCRLLTAQSFDLEIFQQCNWHNFP